MRELSSCFSEYAIQVASDASCSSSNQSCTSSTNLIPSIQYSVTYVYKSTLSNQEQNLITVTWIKNSTTHGLSISFGNDQLNNFKLNTNSRFFRRLKGTKFLEVNESRIEINWDLSAANYNTGPEPVNGYYVIISIGSELGLILGDLAEKRVKPGTQMAKFSLVSRKEHFSGNTLYSTKAQFCDSGAEHDILIKCSGETEGFKHPILSVWIDKKNVIRVKRLQWNFRGNHSIFVDGLLVDLMWDVHDWFFKPCSSSSSSSSGFAVFMFRTRSGMDSRLWLEEKMLQKEQEKIEFSLLIYACKSS
jgi:hypothetical protein